jgi:hypothetical protein
MQLLAQGIRVCVLKELCQAVQFLLDPSMPSISPRRRRLSFPLRNALAMLLALPTLAAQEFRFVDAPWGHVDGACYDEARQRVVFTGLATDHWEWDGVHWSRRPVQAPTDLHVLLHDPLRRRTLAFAGDYVTPLRAWAFAGEVWAPLAQGAVLPPLRSSAAMVYDRGRQRVLLFGGVAVQGDLADTWLFDGMQWQLANPPSAPPARGNAMIAYDLQRQRVVLFGGFARATGSSLGDTWEWNGTTWSQPVLTSSPAPRYGGAFAFDPSRQQVLLVGGFDLSALPDQWTYDGATWALLPGTSPGGARSWATLVFDGARNTMLSFGGDAGQGFTNEAFAMVGTTWVPVAGFPVAPIARVRPAAAVEPGGQNAVVFGGFSIGRSGARNDTWCWDGRTWTERTVLGPKPSPRGASVAWTLGGTTYLFGGTTLSPASWFGDTWTWNGSAWSQLMVPQAPLPRAYSAVAVDIAANRAVLFGGQGPGYLDDTWTFDGTTWTPHLPSPSPGPRATHSMAYDPVRARTVLVGGWTTNGPTQDTWEWDGANWQQVVTAHQPPARGSAAYDLRNNRVAVVGFEANVVGVREPSLWHYDGVDWAQQAAVGVPPAAPSVPVDSPLLLAGPHDVLTTFDSYGVAQWLGHPAALVPYGSPCTAGAPRLCGTTWPQPGAAGFTLEVLDAPAGNPVALVGATNTAAIPVGGCQLLVQPGEALVFLMVLPTQSVARQALPIPNNPGLLGVSLYFQAAALDAGAPAGFTLSAGLGVRIGD